MTVALSHHRTRLCLRVRATPAPLLRTMDPDDVALARAMALSLQESKHEEQRRALHKFPHLRKVRHALCQAFAQHSACCMRRHTPRVESDFKRRGLTTVAGPSRCR